MNLYTDTTTIGSTWAPKYLHIVGICLGAALITTNVFSFKLISVYGLTFGAGTLLLPVCLVLGDIITEVYGFRRARSVIITSLCCFLYYAIMSQVVVALPAAPQWKYQHSLAEVFSFAPRVFVAGACAYLAGELSNSFVMSRMKTYSDGRNFLGRAVASTVVGEFLNSVVFFTIVFWNSMENSVIFATILNGTILKTALEVVLFPVTSKVVAKLKELEGVEFFDKLADDSQFQQHAA